MDLIHGIQTAFTAMIPVGELRLSIPVAIYQYGLPWHQALGWSLFGNIIIIPCILFGLTFLERIVTRLPSSVQHLFRWRVGHLKATQSKKFQKYGAFALVAIVAIPLPLTGAWSGSLAAWLFQVPIYKALPLLILGVLLAGIIVTIATVVGGSFATTLTD